MRLKVFSPLEIKIRQFLFMEKLTYIKLFVLVVPNTIGFARETYPLHYDHMTHFLKINNPETD